ncbi:hypothetical protein MUK51_01745 [Sphingobacterium faecium]|uniref:hypothetical protein n=1 Tax=Sphingobacterium faecium TaxID=34087 RepID=UPI0021B672F8|nr:hypothetical protein [Sphingobacterium faecium]UXD70016.1 hypothetical protein MUK51_01745 [Sphingobacterium faecium]
MDNKDYLLINNIQILDEFRIHYGSIYDNPNKECLRAVLKVNKRSNNHFYFTPGYKSYDDKYFECPLSVIYTQLNFIEIINTENTSTFKAEVVVFSKNFRQTRNLNINSTLSNRGSRPVLNPMLLNGVINLINSYVDAGYDIDLLNVEYIEKNLDIPRLCPSDLLSIINALKFEFFSNDQIRVGKDNWFWEEVVISNLTSDYLRKLFVSILSKSNILDTCRLNDSGIIGTYHHHNAWCGSDGRRPIGLNENKVEEIKDYLKMNILEVYNPATDINERLIKRI